MSLCKKIHKKTLPMSAKRNINQYSVKHKEIPLCTCNKGSMTIEAAVVFPVFAAFIISLLFFFRVLQVETEVAKALSYAQRLTAVESTLTDSEAVQLATAEVLFRKEIAKSQLVREYVAGKGQGITLLSSSAKGDYIKLCATYKIKLPLRFFLVSGFTQTQKCVGRKWTGKSVGEDDSDPYVYYTETGKVYHLTKSCPYLDLSIQKVLFSEVASLRNKSKRKYKACSKCAAGAGEAEYVYITDYGTLYHMDLGCSRLKRTIYTVHLSEVGGRPPCSKCGKGKDN